jgi:hypothetical protein
MPYAQGLFRMRNIVSCLIAPTVDGLPAEQQQQQQGMGRITYVYELRSQLLAD